MDGGGSRYGPLTAFRRKNRPNPYDRRTTTSVPRASRRARGIPAGAEGAYTVAAGRGRGHTGLCCSAPFWSPPPQGGRGWKAINELGYQPRNSGIGSNVPPRAASAGRPIQLVRVAA